MLLFKTNEQTNKSLVDGTLGYLLYSLQLDKNVT